MLDKSSGLVHLLRMDNLHEFTLMLLGFMQLAGAGFVVVLLQPKENQPVFS